MDVAKFFSTSPKEVWEEWCMDELLDALEYIAVHDEIEQRKADAEQKP